MMPVPPSISAQMVALTEPPFGDVSRWDKLGQIGDRGCIQVGSFDFAEAGSETILIMLVKTTNHPNKNTAARDTFCVHLSCSLQIAGIGMMIMMRSHIVLNAA